MLFVCILIVDLFYNYSLKKAYKLQISAKVQIKILIQKK